VSYTVVFKPSAEKEFEKLPPQIQDRVAAALSELETKPRPSGCKKLKAREGYRIRVGDYRIVYFIDDVQALFEFLPLGIGRKSISSCYIIAHASMRSGILSQKTLRRIKLKSFTNLRD
jgi:mRNA interferase RelE/StbE